MADGNLPLLQVHDPGPANPFRYNSHPSEEMPPKDSTADVGDPPFVLVRGPRYREYAALRELRRRQRRHYRTEEAKGCDLERLPPKKQMKFQTSILRPRKETPFRGALAQSVPDFSAALKKENRKPPIAKNLTSTPPCGPKVWSKSSPVLSGSKSFQNLAGGKRNNNVGGSKARKSYASMEELRSSCAGALSAIHRESKKGILGVDGNAGNGRTILGNRKLY